MSVAVAAPGSRRWLVPEVVQTSAMDCGPATLKCLLEGFHIPVSYGRLREACQTDVDGTSIDTLEVVANQLGVPVEQIMIPPDHVLLSAAQTLPAIVVVRHRDGAAHFVVVWRRHGKWLQVMDPAIGRRWVACDKFADEVYSHSHGVAAAQWRQWAATADNLDPFRQRLSALGASPGEANALLGLALKDPGWFAIAVLDASARLVDAVVKSGGVKAGASALKLLNALFERTCRSTADIFTLIPRHYWSVTPNTTSGSEAHRLLLQGAVLLRVTRPPHAAAGTLHGASEATPPLSPELKAALGERSPHPLRALWDMLKADGTLAPLALIGAMCIAAGAVLIETLLFRGLFDMTWLLTQPSQRMAAVLGLMAFVLILQLIGVPIVMEMFRLGRHLETRLRMALLRKLPRLTDRYFHSRPLSDMADRSHSIQWLRHVPATGLHFIQALWELLLTLIGIILIDPASVWIALLIVACAVTIALGAQPMINERDLRVRSHAAALHTFYLDALLGLVPVRTHGAQKAVSRQHEGLLVEWARASRGLIRMSLATGSLQSLICLALAGYLLIDHFLRAGGVTGADLLLVYWALKLPAIGGAIAALARQYPAQRNVLLRLLEPLSAPEAATASTPAYTTNQPPNAAAGIAITQGSVLAAGHTILRDIELTVRPGEHVAIVGKSGAGKSTLIGLLLGWHRLAGGTLAVDGAPLSAAHLETLRRETAWVDPAIQIWNSAFMDNLGYATPDDGLARMGGVIDAANLRGVLQKLPRGLQTYLGEGGGLLSGGEGQRVRLARAFLQTSVRLALLDEPFRGMDRAQRSALLADARQWWQHTTLLCVTHDVGETLSFNRVLVIEDGRIIEDGLPQQLAQGASRYRDLLDTEKRVREQLWQGKQWRRLYLRDGRLESA